MYFGSYLCHEKKIRSKFSKYLLLTIDNKKNSHALLIHVKIFNFLTTYPEKHTPKS